MKTLRNSKRLRKKGGLFGFTSSSKAQSPKLPGVSTFRNLKSSIGMKGYATFDTVSSFYIDFRRKVFVQTPEAQVASKFMGDKIHALISSKYNSHSRQNGEILFDISDIVLDSVLTGKDVTTYPKYNKLVEQYSKFYRIRYNSSKDGVYRFIGKNAYYHLYTSIYETRMAYDPRYGGIDNTTSKYAIDFIKKFDSNPTLQKAYHSFARERLIEETKKEEERQKAISKYNATVKEKKDEEERLFQSALAKNNPGASSPYTKPNIHTPTAPPADDDISPYLPTAPPADQDPTNGGKKRKKNKFPRKK